MGDARADFGLAELLGAHFTGTAGAEREQAGQSQHTYLRLSPELRGGVNGPNAGDEPRAAGTRHVVLRGFEETDIIPFGGSLTAMKVDSGAIVPLTFVPPFPIYPPETAWMRQPKTDIPGLVLKGNMAFLPADVDRRYNREALPDYGDLLANLVRWAANGEIPLRLEAPGLFDCNLYTQNLAGQPGRIIAHIVNLTSTARAPIDELIPSGPVKVSVRLPKGISGRDDSFGAGPRGIGHRVNFIA
jgi:hypothetical protein